MMRKILSVLLLITIVLSAIPFSFSASAAEMPLPKELNGYENVCLTYTYRPNGRDYGRQFTEDLLPYVAYIDREGLMQDFFFDTYLFLPCNTYAPSGATIHGGVNNPTIASDWEDYVYDTFHKDANVDALDEAFGIAKNALADNEKKAGVIFSILYPSHTVTNFGSLGGRSLNLSKQEDREYAIKWIIDEQIRLYQEGGYENLDLLGFYWLEEEIYSDYDESMMQYASNYLHSLGLKFVWIPWFQAPGYQYGENYGFDVVCMQPNDMWPEKSNPDRVQDCADLCKRYGLSMQIEASHDCDEPDRYGRYMKYLDVGMRSGAMDAIKFYYQDGKTAVYYAACYSDDDTFRSIYDLTYKYAKGTLEPRDVSYYVEDGPFELPEDVEWVSYGKSYTGTPSYVDGNGMPYQEVEGNELTDGVLGSSCDGTEWHAYHYKSVDKNGVLSTTIDLGQVYSDLTCVAAQFLDYDPYSICPPQDVKLYMSTDGQKFILLNEVTLSRENEMCHFVMNREKPFTARYIKITFKPSDDDLVFCSELMVGRPIPDETTEVTSEVTEESQVTEKEEEQKESNIWLYVRVGISALLMVALAVIFFVKRRKK